MKTEVLIIGAGPTGLSLAAQLIRYGIDFVILDKAPGTSEYSKALGVQARTLEIYEQIGIAGELIEAGAIAESVRFAVGGEVRAEVDLKGIGEGMSPYPFLLIVEQGVHEKILYRHLKENGADVLWNHEFAGLRQSEAGVTAEIIAEDGNTFEIEAKFLVGCDGASSRVRHFSNMSFEGSTFERLFYVADANVDWKFSHHALHVCLAADTVTVFFPMVGENRYRIVGVFPENEERREGEVLYEEIEEQIIKDTELDLDISNIRWFSVYKVHSRRVDNFRDGRCFLAGDSAHIHTPAGAQGMNTGIQDAYNLAWKLAAVLRHGAPLPFLDSYNEERLANAKQLLKTTDRFFDLGAGDEWFSSFFRLYIFPYFANLALSLKTVQRFVFPLVSQIGINYRDSSLSKGSGEFNVQAGDRMPYFEIDGISIYEMFNKPKFHLLRFSEGSGELEDTATAWGDGFLDIHELPLDDRISEIFGTDYPFVLLLRPDNYIGFISSETEQEEVKNYFGLYTGDIDHSSSCAD